MSERDPFSSYRERLAAVGFRPSRQLGQNFLLQPELHRVIADTGDLTPEDVALEIGAGLGFLTRELALRAHRVIAVEIDARLHALLVEELAAMPGGERVRPLHTDVLARGGRLASAVTAALAEECAGRELRVVANLPYAVTGPVLAALCTGDPLPATIAILIQREAALRLAATPSSAAWGSLSVLVQSSYSVRIARRVGREVFRPRPNVDSAIVQLRRRPDGLATSGAADRSSFATFARALFSGRRKKVRHRIVQAAEAAHLTAPDLTSPWPVLEARPVDLDVMAMVELWRTVRTGS